MLPIRTILFLFSTVAICVNAFSSKSGCWEEDKNYQGVQVIKIRAGEKCRSHCFERDHCTVISVEGNLCYRQTDSMTSYRLKESCRGDNCWSSTSLTKASLEWRNTKNVQQCKSICLETPVCYHYSYTEGKCYIQTDKDFLKGITFDKKPILMKLSQECKDETCWKRMEYSFVEDLTKQAGKSEPNCRVLCYENTKCKLYIYNEATGDCQIQTEDVELKGPKDNPSYTTFKMEPICWNGA